MSASATVAMEVEIGEHRHPTSESDETQGAGRYRDPNLVIVHSPRDLRQLTSDLRDPQRTTPVIGLGGTGTAPSVTPSQLRAILGSDIRIYYVASPRAQMRLAQRLGPALAVSTGIRIWWPGLTPDSDSHDHPLVTGYENEQETLQAFAAVFDRSRPTLRSLRTQLAITEKRLAETQKELRAAKIETKEAKKAAANAKTELREIKRRFGLVKGVGDAQLVTLGNMDGEEAMHLAIFTEWLRLTAADRSRHPLGEYMFGPQFLATVHDSRTRVSGDRVAFACAMVACRRLLSSLEPHPLPGVSRGSGRRHKNEREDGAKGWVCQLGTGAGAKRLVYWTHPGGKIEFEAVQGHDEVGRR